MTLQEIMKKNEPKLDGLHPTVKEGAIQLLENCFKRGVLILITCGYRSFEEQQRLYNQGRITKGDIVTNAKPGTSYHQYGLAIDFCLLKNGKQAVWDTKVDFDGDKHADWMEVIEEARKLKFECGIDWNTMYDPPHLQMSFGYSISRLLNGQRPPVPKKEEPKKENETHYALCNVRLDGKTLPFQAFLIMGKSYLPVRTFGNLLGASVGWNAALRQASLNNFLLKTTTLLNETGFATIREMSEVLGLEVGWDGKTSTVILNKR